MRFLLFILFFVGCSSESLNKYEVSQNRQDSVDEVSLKMLINNYRIGEGEKSLLNMIELKKYAIAHNKTMINDGFISHKFFFTRSEAILTEIDGTNVSENIAKGYVSNVGVFNAWKQSDKHNENMLGDWKYFNIAIDKDSLGNKYYTNIFLK